MKKRIIATLLVPIFLLVSTSFCFGQKETRKVLPVRKAPVRVVPTKTPEVGIKSVDPAKVMLKPGGGAMTVVVAGTNLDAITNASVLLEGRPVKTVGVAVDAKSSGGVKLVLKAASDAKPAENYQLRLTAGKQIIDVPAKMLNIGVIAVEPAKVVQAKPTRPKLAKRSIPVDKVLVRSVSESHPEISLSDDVASKKLTITGINLDRITAAEIVSGDERVPETTVQLGQQSKASVEVTIRVFPQARPGNYQLRLILSERSMILSKDILDIKISRAYITPGPYIEVASEFNVTKFTPGDILLWRGKRGQIIILEGEALNLISEAKVLRNNQPVSNTTEIKTWFANSEMDLHNTVDRYPCTRFDHYDANGVTRRILVVRALSNAICEDSYTLQLTGMRKTINISREVVNIKVTEPLPEDVQFISPQSGDVFLYNHTYYWKWKAEANSRIYVRLRNNALSDWQTPEEAFGGVNRSRVVEFIITRNDGLGMYSWFVNTDHSDGFPDSSSYNLEFWVDDPDRANPHGYTDQFAIMASQEPPHITRISSSADTTQGTIYGTNLLPKRSNELEVIVDYGEFKYCVRKENRFCWESTGERDSNDYERHFDRIFFCHPGPPWPKMTWNGRDEIDTRVSVIVNGKQSNWVDYTVKKLPVIEPTQEYSLEHDAVFGDRGDESWKIPAFGYLGYHHRPQESTNTTGEPPTYDWIAPAYAEVVRTTNDDGGGVSIVEQPIDPVPGDIVEVHYWFDRGSDANYKIIFYYRHISGFNENFLRE